MSPSQRDPGDEPDFSTYPYLASLNSPQLQAVTASPTIPIQILAGPGSGKTRVLTSRVAYLVQKHGFRPHQITAVTFTNKSASEMRKRLEVLLGPQQSDQLILGTFHATCARYLRRYGKRICLDNSFTVADSDDCKKIMSRILKEHAPRLEDARIVLKEGAVLSDISKAKAKEQSPEDLALQAAQDPSSSTGTPAVLAELYQQYEEALRESNSLDFDDLLVFGLRLFRAEPDILASCRHILVDEFQDTNKIQYELMRCFAKANGGVSVVGDPDQSIYGWRSADIENLNKMVSDFPSVEAIYLEENYRSTGSILAASHSVVSQDPKRISKSLYTSHPKSTPVTLKHFSSPVIEAGFIANEIRRLIAYSGNVLKFDDFAILLRYNALSRVIESALQKDAIPNRIIGGHKFFERMEIKDLLAYLQLADNPNFTPAFLRVVNVPRRAIGEKSLIELVAAAKKEKVSPMELSERIFDGDKLPPGIKPTMKRNLASFVGVVRKLRRASLNGMSVANLIRIILEKTQYEDYLRTSQQDFDQRWENVQELLNYSVTVAEEHARQIVVSANGFTPVKPSVVSDVIVDRDNPVEPHLHPMFRHIAYDTSSRRRSGSVIGSSLSSVRARVNVENEVVEVLSSDDEIDQSPAEYGILIEDAQDTLTPLRFFLQTSMLSTDSESNDENIQTPKVTISTVHAAKGLEWPVVFIPAVEQGTFPSYRCTAEHEIAEERRLLYVAMTRAQSFLTMSYCQSRMSGGEEKIRELSEFVDKSQRHNPTIFSPALSDIDIDVRRQVSVMLERPIPDEEETKCLIMKHVRVAPPLSTWDAPEPRGKFSRFARRDVNKSTTARATDYWSSERDDYALSDGSPSQTGFVTAARLAQMPRSVPKLPPPRLQSANRGLPGPIPFTFDANEPIQRETGLGTFTSSSSTSLAAMKALGLPDTTALSVASSTGTSVRAKSLYGSTAISGAGTSDVPLARGTKRLGMGRPAPWGSAKRAK